MALQDLSETIVADFMQHMKPRPILTVSEWADKYRHLPPESSPEPGKWRTIRTPYLKGLMDAVNEPGVHTIAAMTASQVGKSEAINNIMFYFMHQDPCPILMVQPTLTDAEDYSKTRISASVRATPVLRELLGDDSRRTRKSSNTILSKNFPGGRMAMVGSNSASGLSSKPIRVVLGDEIDRYEITREGDAIELARQRMAAFWNSLLVLTSTPSIKGVSQIERWYELSDKRMFFVPCIHCGHWQVLKWGHVVWDRDENGNHIPHTAMYACDDCGVLLNDAQLMDMVAEGEWRATAPFTGIAGFGELNELYSPFRKMAQTVQSFLDSKDDPELFRVWVNTRLGETWEAGDSSFDVNELYERRESYDLMVPLEAGAITASVDVQDDRLECLTEAWGKNEESWMMEHVVFRGDPGINCNIKDDPNQLKFDGMEEPTGVWAQLYDFLRKEYDHESGVKIPISCVAVDTGGHHTDSAYEFCRQCKRPVAYAIKGASQRGKPIVGRPTRSNKARIPLYTVGVHAAKDVIAARLARSRPGPGYIHIPDYFDYEFFEQLASEKKVPRKQAGRTIEVWLQVRKRNEGWDLTVYNLIALRIKFPTRETIHRLVEKYRAIADQKNSEKQSDKEKPTPKKKKKSGGFVTSW